MTGWMHAPQPRVTPRRTIRFWLNCLVIACIVPALIVTTFIIYQSFNQERAGLERDTVGTARALSQAVDAELAGVRSALVVLSKSANLASGDLAGFYAQAQQVVRALNIDNIVLSDVRGQQLINTLRPFGTPLPLHDRDELRRALAAGQPVISDLFIGAVSQRPIIIIEGPVLVGGETRYALAFGIFPARLNEILQRQKMPPDWVAAIVDSSDTIVARTIGGDEFIGKKVSADLKRELAAVNEGFFEGKTIEGIPVLSSFSRSQFSGWSVAIGIPKATFLGALRQALLSNIVAALVLLAGGTLLARRMSGRIADSIHALRGPAIEMGSAGPLVVPPVAIQEAHLLGQSLVAAHGLVQQRTAERDDLRRRLMSAQEEERLRLAHDLHDQTGQGMTAAILELKVIEPFVGKKGLDRVRFLRKHLDELSKLLHRTAWELRPLSIDELGLTNALENYLSNWAKKLGINADFHCSDSELDGRSNEIRTTVYRVVQEGLTNIARHAVDATRVSVVIGMSQQTLYLVIEDNGRGFDPAATPLGLGLAGMRERLLLVGGRLTVESSDSTGTTVFARIPIRFGSVA
jgi:signal transduction histidine kinase